MCTDSLDTTLRYAQADDRCSTGRVQMPHLEDPPLATGLDYGDYIAI